MNILTFTRFVRGYVEFKATGSFPERLINLSLRRGLNVYDTRGSGGVLSGRVPKSQFQSLKKLSERCGVDVEIIKSGGIPVIYRNNKNRVGLLFGAVLLAVICQLLSSFVWTVDVKPTESVSEYKIRQALEKQGLYSGVWKNSINPDTVERDTMLDLGSFGWMSINITGTNAQVSISEKYLPEDTQGDETKPCNIKAKKDGQIVKMDIKSGSNAVKLGDAVTKGDLLVSGVVSTTNGGDHLRPAVGAVYARTTFTKTVAQPLCYIQSMPTGITSERSVLNFIGIKIPLGLSYVPSENYVKQGEYQDFVSFGNTMPVGVYNQHCTEYLSEEVKLTEEQANESCLAQLSLYEAFEINKCKIEERKLTPKIQDNAYIVTAEYTCIEDIGEISYIGVENEEQVKLNTLED